MTEAQHPQLNGTTDTDTDRYPTLAQILSRILDDSDLLDLRVERLEVTLFASGEATYRVWAPRAEESDGGYYGPPEA